MVGIYAIRNMLNGRMYIGSSKNIVKRWENHRYRLRKNMHHCKYLQNSWSKNGADYFEFVILEECDECDLKDYEQKWLDAFPDKYNHNPYAYRPDEDTIKNLVEGSRAYHNSKPSARIRKLMINYNLVDPRKWITKDSWDIIGEDLEDPELFDELWDRVESGEELF